MRCAQTSWRVCPNELHKLSRIAVIQPSIDDFMHCHASSYAFLFTLYSLYLAFLMMKNMISKFWYFMILAILSSPTELFNNRSKIVCN